MAELTVEYVRECLDYDPDTGVFTWRERPAGHFKTARARSAWNARFSGGAAGGLDHRGYCYVRIGGKKSFLAHRLAWLHVYGAWPREQIDHINQIKSDNRLANLREASQKQNLWNTGARGNNQAGLKGVSPLGRRFVAQIRAGRKRKIYLGLFKTPEEAHAAYCAAAERHHGEFANGGGSA